MIKQLTEAIQEGFQVQFRPYVGKVIIHLSIHRKDNLYEFNRVVPLDDEDMAAAIEFIKSEIKKTWV